MFEIGYDFIREIFSSIEDNNTYVWFTRSYKFLACSFFVLNIYSNFFSNRWDWAGEVKLPFDKNKLVTSFAVVLLIVFYDKFLGILDGLLSGMDKSVNDYTPLVHDLSQDEITEADGDIGVWAYLKKAAGEYIDFMRNPTLLFFKLAYYLLWLMDNIVYTLFLVERFFFLTVLKILGPFVFCMAIFEKFREYLKKWIMLYTGFWLLIIPYFLVIFITNEMYTRLYDQVEGSNVILVKGIENTLLAIITGLSFFIKYRLFKKSTDIIYRLFA